MTAKDILSRFKQFSFFDTFKHSSTYFTGTLLTQALGIISLPVFTALLTSEEYGIVNVFTSYVLVFSVLLSLYLHGATSRYYFEKDKDDFDSFLGAIVITVTLFFAVFGAIVFSFRELIAKIINLPVQVVIWLLITSYLVVFYTLFTQIMIATKESKKFATVQVVWHYLKFICAVLGFLYLAGVTFSYSGQESSYTFMGKIIGEVIATVLIILYTTYQIFKFMSFKGMSIKHIKYAMVYALPLIPFALSNYILTSFDQWYINSSIGQSQAGQYAFAYKIGLLFLGLILALLNGAQPSYFNHMNNKEYGQIKQQVDSITKLMVLGACFLILFAIDVGTLLSSKDIFLTALPIAPVIVGGYVFHGVSSFYNRGIYFAKKNGYLAAIVLLSGIINIYLNLYFIPIYGYQAAAYTTLFSYFMMMLFSIIVTTYILKLPSLPLGRITKYIVLLASVISINYIFGQPNLGLNFGWIIFKLLLFSIFGCILFYNKIGIFFGRT